MKVYPNRTGALCANSHPRSYTGQDAFNDMLLVIERNSYALLDETVPLRILDGRVSSTLKNNDYKNFTDVVEEEHMEDQQKKYVLRRLTPTECLRLQGLPDWWVDGVNGSDSAIYRMAGNGLAVPCACDVLGRIAEELRNNG